MEQLQIREAEIFRVMKKLEASEFVLIGGYAVNSYALPRFSVDCDIAISKDRLKGLLAILEREGFAVRESNLIRELPYGGNFVRLEKITGAGFVASFDVLVDSVYDRQSGASFSIDWLINNSTMQNLVGKTINEKIRVRVASSDALFVMKLASKRVTDCRDIFMLAPVIKDRKRVRIEAEKFMDFQKNAQTVLKKVTDPKFKNNLAGVYGYIDELVFKKHLDAIKRILARIE